MRGLGGTGLKVGIFMVVMLMLTAALFAIFGQYRAATRTDTPPFSTTSRA